MYKLSIPLSVALSSGSLTLLALVSLLATSNTVYTSDIQQLPEIQAANLTDLPVPIKHSVPEAYAKTDERRRSGRAYGQQSALESYAAAYAAANAPSSADQQTSVPATDAYSSFGETAPNSHSSSLSGPHSSYYASFMSPSSNEASYSGQQSAPAHHHYQQNYFKLPMSSYDRHSPSGYYDRMHAGSHSSASTPMWSGSSFGGTGNGLMSSATSALSHWTSGFTISEIICTIVAIAIGAIILGAPFFLIYLALMGNFSGSGTLSLTNPTQGTTPATTTVNGRKKRLAIFEQMNTKSDHKNAKEFVALADAISAHLSPYVDIRRITDSFKTLISSIEKYSNVKPTMRM